MNASLASWDELDAVRGSGKRNRKVAPPVAIIPVGSLEQHGVHLPLSTDTLVAEYVASAVEKRLKDRVILFPSIYYSCSSEHGRFPGTVSISYRSFLSYMEDVVKSLFDNGFKNVAIINSHGGNIALLSVLQRQLNFASDTKGKLHILDTIDDSLAKSIFDGKGIFHAGFVETSLLESFQPGLVKSAPLRSMKPSDFRAASKEGVFVTLTTKEVSETGMVDDSEPFSRGEPERGRKMLTEIIDRLAKKLRQLN